MNVVAMHIPSVPSLQRVNQKGCYESQTVTSWFVIALPFSSENGEEILSL
jgi:hypothetical protein